MVKFDTSKSLSLRQTEALLQSIGDGAIATDEYGRITLANRASLQILGFTEGELLGNWFPKKIVAVNDDGSPVNLIDRPITKAFLTGRPINEKTTYIRKDGKTVPVSLTVSPILQTNRPTGAIEIFRDITFEQEVDRMKSEFISLASHQLRTPLSAIKTYSHMLNDGYMGELQPAQRKALGTIIGASNRMNELISTLLNITRIESGTIAVTRKTVKLEKLADEVVHELSHLATNRQVTLTSHRHGQASTSLKTDPLIIKEVLSNLVSNAIKYTPEQGQVDINLRPRRADVLIEVHDTGWGIPNYSQDQVFSKFFRAQNIVRKETSGTGLGLYLVKGLLDALGGRIWFQSNEGEGTSFYFTVPRVQARVAKPKSSSVKPRA